MLAQKSWWTLARIAAACMAFVVGATASACGGGGAANASGADGFGKGGKVFTAVDAGPLAGSESIEALAIDDNGRIVATTGRFDLMRYRRDGHLDRRFGSGGKVHGGWGSGTEMALQNDGKIILAGAVGKGTYKELPLVDFALARYTRQGRLDPSFGKGGKVRTHLVRKDTSYGSRHSPSQITALAIQGDGKIIAGGSAGLGGEWALVRYTASGQLDPSFGRGGTIFTRAYRGFVLAIGGDGKIVVAGTTPVADKPQGFVLTRYTSEGKLDSSFGRGGIVSTPAFRRPSGEPAFRGPSGEAEYATPHAIAIRPDGLIVVAGSSQSGIALARYTADGRLDPSFGRGGVTNDDPQRRFYENAGVAYAAAFQRDGKIVSVGRALAPHSDWKTEFALARHTAAGELDRSFGGGGIVVANVGPLSEARVVAIQPDGKIIAGGTGKSSAVVALVRVKPNGRPDS